MKCGQYGRMYITTIDALKNRKIENGKKEKQKHKNVVKF